jgi:hypothetical protein
MSRMGCPSRHDADSTSSPPQHPVSLMFLVGASSFVYSLSVGLPLVRTVGSPGNGAAIGAALQMDFPRLLCVLPFKSASVLVDDPFNGRVLEADVVTGNLVKIWATKQAGTVSSPAASMTLVAICTSGMQLNVYDTSGALVRSLTPGTTDTWGMRFSMDSSYLVVSDRVSTGSVKKIRISDGTVLTPVASVSNSLVTDVEECMSPATGSIAMVVIDDNDSGVAVYDGVSPVTPWRPGISRGLGFTVVPGFGVLVATLNSGRLQVLTSVAIATQPSSATVSVGGSVSFSIGLLPNSSTNGVTFAWTKDGVAVGTNSSTYTYVAVDTDAERSFSIMCTVTHATGLAVSNPATLTVQVRAAKAQSSSPTLVPGPSVS